MTTTKLNERAMLVSLNLSRWEAARKDRKESAAVAKRHGLKEGRARVQKDAIDKAAPTYQAVVTAASALRNTHYELTLPWANDGARILTTAMFENYATTMRKLRKDYEAAVESFCQDYPKLKAAAKSELNGMYNEDDYPTNIRGKFSVNIVTLPMPDAEDFRAVLSEGAVSEIKEQIRAEQAKAIEDAMRDPYERLYKAVSGMAAKLADKKGIFRDTLVTNIVELCQILPALNLTGDAQLEKLRQQAEQLVKGLDPQDLREVPAVRRATAKKAREIQDTMADFLGAAAGEAA